MMLLTVKQINVAPECSPSKLLEQVMGYEAALNNMRHYLSRNSFSISVSQLMILVFLKREGCLSQQDIAVLSCRDKSSVQRNIDSLNRSGFVSINKEATDRRKNMLTLTDKGLSICHYFSV